MLAAVESRTFDTVLVDDLSRLARDNYLMPSILAELRANGVRVWNAPSVVRNLCRLRASASPRC